MKRSVRNEVTLIKVLQNALPLLTFIFVITISHLTNEEISCVRHT